MAKKPVKPVKSNVQRTREEQWKRRLAAQGGTVASGATLEREDMGVSSDGMQNGEAAFVSGATSGATRTAVSSSTRTAAAARGRSVPLGTGSAQRRMAQPARAGRLKLAANTMSIDEEMHYVRSDIRRLIILTAICLAVLIALSFVIR